VREGEFSVFIHNLPSSLDKYGLAGIFQKAGAIADTYIPLRQGPRIRGRFGFVRFYKLEDARRCIALFNKGRIRGMRIHVSMARPKKQSHQNMSSKGTRRNVVVRKVWRKKYSGPNQQKAGREDEEGVAPQIIVRGQTNEVMEEWLERTLVCTTEQPRDMATLESAIIEGIGQPFKLRALSCVQFLLTFENAQTMYEILEQQVELEHWFINVKKWSLEDRCETRRVWLEVIGVPPHGWKWENFKDIAEKWGKFISLGRSTLNTESFETMRVQIATAVFQKIEAEILLQVGFGGYRVMVREVETVSQMARIGECASHEESKSDIPGFEDIGDNIRNTGEEDAEGWNREIQNGPEEEEDKESQGSYGSGHKDTSNTRTKTVSFSQNGYEEELLKVEHHLRLLGKRKEKEGSQPEEDSTSPPPGFELEMQNNHSNSIKVNGDISKNNDGQEKTNDRGLSEQSNPVYSPSFMNEDRAGISIDNSEDANQKRSYKIALLQNNAESSSSTPESLVKLAKESLHIGELIGIRVTGNVEAAISRITTPLKKIRKRSKKSKRSVKD